MNIYSPSTKMNPATLQVQSTCEPFSGASNGEEFPQCRLPPENDKNQAASCMPLRNRVDATQSWTSDQKVVLNVGGTKHEIFWAKLEKLPHSRLGRLKCCKTEEELKELCDGYSFNDGNEYFFDWNPRSFESILSFYRTGKLHLDNKLCPLAMQDDLQYWRIDEFAFESCCQNKYLQNKDITEELKKQMESLQRRDEDSFNQTRCSNFRKCLWNIMENPKSSLMARVVNITSILFTILLAITLSLKKIPFFLDIDREGFSEDNRHLNSTETVCIAWFAFEYIMRFLSSPNKWKFFKKPLNILDVLVIIPYFLYLLLIEIDYFRKFPLESLLDLLQVFRILMILKLARLSKRFQVLASTLRSSSKELGLFLFILYIGTMIFGTLIHDMEFFGEEIRFRNRLESVWWAGIAMITMNICSDSMCPTTPQGKFVGTVCCLCGVLVIALPIPIISNNFANFYEKQKMQERVLKIINTKEKDDVDSKKTFNQVVCNRGAEAVIK